jgi:hypothetical protein
MIIAYVFFIIYLISISWFFGHCLADLVVALEKKDRGSIILNSAFCFGAIIFSLFLIISIATNPLL